MDRLEEGLPQQVGSKQTVCRGSFWIQKGPINVGSNIRVSHHQIIALSWVSNGTVY